MMQDGVRMVKKALFYTFDCCRVHGYFDAGPYQEKESKSSITLYVQATHPLVAQFASLHSVCTYEAIVRRAKPQPT
jgi:hypothetical protein